MGEITDVKRLNYFTSQFLVEKDFKDEQEYHRLMRRFHNLSLHTKGVVDDGFKVSGAGSGKIKIDKGFAIDGEGNEIILLASKTVELSPVGNNKNLKLFVSTKDFTLDEDRYTAAGIDNFSRITERPMFVFYGGGQKIELRTDVRVENGNPPTDSPEVPLANIEIDGNGKITIDDSVRINAGSKIGEITAEQVGALPTKGGMVTGDLSVSGELTVKQSAEFKGKINVDADSSIGVRIDAGNTGRTDVSLLVGIGKIRPEAGLKAAVAGISSDGKIPGIYAEASDPKNIALRAKGTVEVDGKLVHNHTVETFINGCEHVLYTGQLVKLKGTPVSHFRGTNNDIPVPEVILADRENDKTVIGFIDGCPSSNTETGDGDQNVIPPGNELHIVTLGAFSNCMADATQEPIEVGDLLTSSSKPGHVKKATKYLLGTVVGKALEPLATGMGNISVFVNMQ